MACHIRLVRDQASRGTTHLDLPDAQSHSTIYQTEIAKMLRHLITPKTSTRQHQTKTTTTQTPVHPLAASPTTNASEGPENGEAPQKNSMRRGPRRVWSRGMAKLFPLYSAIVAARALLIAFWRQKLMTSITCLQ